MLRGDENTWRLINSVGHDNLLDLVPEDILHELAEWLKASLLLLLKLLLILGIIELKSFLGTGDELLAIVLLQLLDHIFINWVSQVDNFVSSGF